MIHEIIEREHRKDGSQGSRDRHLAEPDDGPPGCRSGIVAIDQCELVAVPHLVEHLQSSPDKTGSTPFSIGVPLARVDTACSIMQL